MPRGRIISPDFWSDGNMVGLSPYARLFYIGTWNFAYCDNGHVPDDAMELKLKILPADPVDGSALIDELLDCGRLVRELLPDGRTYLFIPTFGSYQKADTRWKPRCPICRTTPNHTVTLPNSPEHIKTLPTTETRGGEGKGEEGNRGGGKTPPPRKCPKHMNDSSSPPCGACRDARLEREEWDAAKKAAPSYTPPKSTELYCPRHHGMPPVNCERCAEEGL